MSIKILTLVLTFFASLASYGAELYDVRCVYDNFDQGIFSEEIDMNITSIKPLDEKVTFSGTVDGLQIKLTTTGIQEGSIRGELEVITIQDGTHIVQGRFNYTGALSLSTDGVTCQPILKIGSSDLLSHR